MPKVVRYPHRLGPDDRRVIARTFVPEDSARKAAILKRIMRLSDEQVLRALQQVTADFDGRHRNLEVMLARRFDEVAGMLQVRKDISEPRRLLIGAYCTMEYSLESVALFNPSLVPHPDQCDLAPGEVRFIMSLRACGEGHISSIEFRSGVIDASNEVRFDYVSPYAFAARPLADRQYEKHTFHLKLAEMSAYNEIAEHILQDLGDHFTLGELTRTVDAHRKEHPDRAYVSETADNILWLARSNYHLEFPPGSDLSERVIFPVSENESRGIEDARFVRFVHPDGQVVYYATYTAYNGFRILPQLIETVDFNYFKIITLNGRYAQQKGMALFPHMVNDHYMMISRVDGENLYLMASDNLHFWNEAEKLMGPARPWELMQIGNCGSPLETDRGWLLLTHGVGPMRRYCIGAMLLDLEDPRRIIGQLASPLMEPVSGERDGYVPNVVYSCGSMIHNGRLVIPYAMSDLATGVASVALDELLDALTKSARGKKKAAVSPTLTE